MTRKVLTAEELNKKVENLKQENATLKDANASFNDEIQGLKDQITALDAEKKRLNDLAVEYQEKNLGLIDKATQSQEQITDLQVRIDLLSVSSPDLKEKETIAIKLNPNHPSDGYFREGLQFSKESAVFSKDKLGDKLAVLQADSNLIIE